MNPICPTCGAELRDREYHAHGELQGIVADSATLSRIAQEQRMKPHEETWAQDAEEILLDGEIIANFGGYPNCERVRLAAQAPAMARLLVEWLRCNTVDDLNARTRSLLRQAGVLP